ncbi:MAG: arginine--tRNA ligase, partial [Leptospiraceae bacterium]|nr:arginine--tRNA ligase [Leptospiraceae bacterium]
CGYEEAKKLELTEERSRLIFWLGRFLEETYDAGLSMEPHRLCNYLQNLSKAFTQFYMAKNNRLKDAGEQERKGLAYLCELSRICLSEGLKLLGISSPEKLEKVEG